MGVWFKSGSTLGIAAENGTHFRVNARVVCGTMDVGYMCGWDVDVRTVESTTSDTSGVGDKR